MPVGGGDGAVALLEQGEGLDLLWWWGRRLVGFNCVLRLYFVVFNWKVRFLLFEGSLVLLVQRSRLLHQRSPQNLPFTVCPLGGGLFLPLLDFWLRLCLGLLLPLVFLIGLLLEADGGDPLAFGYYYLFLGWLFLLPVEAFPESLFLGFLLQLLGCFGLQGLADPSAPGSIHASDTFPDAFAPACVLVVRLLRLLPHQGGFQPCWLVGFPGSRTQLMRSLRVQRLSGLFFAVAVVKYKFAGEGLRGAVGIGRHDSQTKMDCKVGRTHHGPPAPKYPPKCRALLLPK